MSKPLVGVALGAVLGLSLMPPFTSLSTADLEHLVAYLSPLRPEKAP